jgi:hypothetical protein
MTVSNVAFVTKMRQLSIFSSECQFARSIWNLIQITTNLFPPCSISNMFNYWLWGINIDLKQLDLLGAATFCWAIWRHRNDMVFERKM